MAFLVSCNSGGTSTSNTSSANINSGYQKLDDISTTDNNLVWTKQFGVSGGTTVSNGVAVDNSENSYVVGYTTKGLGTNTQKGYYDAYVAKYNSESGFVWVRQLGSINGNTKGNAIAVDSSGNVYITGFRSVTFNNKTKAGTYDYFIAKYDTNGYQQWIESSAGLSHDNVPITTII